MIPVTVNDIAVRRLAYSEPSRGAWAATVSVGAEYDGAGAVSLAIGARVLRGTATHITQLGNGWQLQLEGGAGKLDARLSAAGYSSASGADLAAVITDACHAAGEDMGTIRVARGGAHYVRPADATLRAVLDGVSEITGVDWYVGDDGAIVCAPRDGVTVEARIVGGATEWVVDLDPEDVLRVGDSVLPITGGESRRVIAQHIVMTPRVYLHAVSVDAEPARQVSTQRLLGVYAYTVQSAQGGKADLSATEQGGITLPALRDVSVVTGIPGATATLAAGGTVYVQFVAGDRTRPIVTGFGSNTVTELSIDATKLTLCGGSAAVALVGAEVQITPDGSTGMLTAPNGPVTQTGVIRGKITATGSSLKVSAG